MAGYKISNQNALHYLTLTTVGWVDVFTRQCYRDIVLESLAYCQREKGLILHAYVIMSNHIHMIAQAQAPSRLSDILRDFKKFTSAMIIKSIQEESESRRDWLLLLFRYHARFNKNNSVHQLWQSDNHPIELYSPDFISPFLKRWCCSLSSGNLIAIIIICLVPYQLGSFTNLKHNYDIRHQAFRAKKIYGRVKETQPWPSGI